MRNILFYVPQMQGPTGDGRLNMDWTDAITQKGMGQRWKTVTLAAYVLAAIAREEGYEITVWDEDFRGPIANQELERVEIVCMYVVTPTASRAYEVSQRVKRNQVWTVMGGPHATAMPEECQKMCHTLMMGEGEYSFRQFLRDYGQGKARARYEQARGKVALAQSPIPAYDELQGEERRLIPMQTARGCSHRCRFCNVHSLYGAGYRAKAEWQIERELRAIEGVSQTKRLYVTDDNIVSREEHFEELMKAFSETQYTWYANADISFGLDRTKIKRAYQSGLRQVLIGLESVNPKVLYTLNPDQYKYRQRDLYLQAIQAIQAEGIGVTGSFIVGHENDGEEQFYQLETFIRESNLYAANITFLTPYPGTPLFQSMKRKGQILTYNWEYYTIFQPVLKVRGATTQQLNGWYLSLLDHIYSVDCANEKARYFADVYRKRRASG